jgi:hypothetical protein
MAERKIEFEEIAVSTRTIIGITNWNINIEKLFDVLPTTEYNVQPKKRGRKRKGAEIENDDNENLKNETKKKHKR